MHKRQKSRNRAEAERFYLWKVIVKLGCVFVWTLAFLFSCTKEVSVQSKQTRLVVVQCVPEQHISVFINGQTKVTPCSLFIQTDAEQAMTVPCQVLADSMPKVPTYDVRYDVHFHTVDQCSLGQFSFVMPPDSVVTLLIKTYYKVAVADNPFDSTVITSEQWVPKDSVFSWKVPEQKGYRFLRCTVNDSFIGSAPAGSLIVHDPLKFGCVFEKLIHLTVLSSDTLLKNIIFSNHIIQLPIDTLMPNGTVVKMSLTGPLYADLDSFVSGSDTRVVLHSWSGDSIGSQSYGFQLTADRDIRVLMDREYKVVITAALEGLVSSTEYIWVKNDSLVAIAPPVFTGFRFSGWSINGTAQASTDSLKLQIDHPTIILQRFIPVFSMTIGTLPDSGLNIMVNGTTKTTPANIIAAHSDSIFVVALPTQDRRFRPSSPSPDVRYKFSGWNSDTNPVNTTYASLASSMGWIAHYRKYYHFAASCEPSWIGSIASSAWNSEDSSVLLVRPSISGYRFMFWRLEDSSVVQDSILRVAMIFPRQVAAVYQQTAPLSIVSIPDTGITVIVKGKNVTTPSTFDYPDSSTATISVPSPQYFDRSTMVAGVDVQYSFIGWGDTITNPNPRNYLIRGISQLKIIMQKNYRLERHLSLLLKDSLVDTTWAPSGRPVTMTAYSLPGAVLDYWEVNGSRLDSGLTLTINVNEPEVVTAVFANTVSLRGSSLPDTDLVLSIGGVPTSCPFTKTVKQGSKDSITVSTPQLRKSSQTAPFSDIRYDFIQWQDNQRSDTLRTVLATQSISLTALFDKKFHVAASTIPSMIGDTSGSGWYSQGSTIRLGAPPVPGYVFSGWVINDSALVLDSALSVDIKKPLTIVKRYRRQYNVKIFSQPDPGLSITVKGVVMRAPVSLSIPDGDTVTFSTASLYELDKDTSVPGADIQYSFIRWDNNQALDTVYSAEIHSDTSVTAFFSKVVYVAVVPSPSVLGTLSGGGWYSVDSSAVFIASHFGGYLFDRWQVGQKVIGTNDTLPWKIPGPQKLTAMYRPQYTQQDMQSLLSGFQPVVGAPGASMVDSVISHYTPDCFMPGSNGDVLTNATIIRERIEKCIRIDKSKMALSSRLQNTLNTGAYTIEVRTVEVEPSILVPVNVYLPKGVTKAPLIIIVPGNTDNMASDYLQYLAGNLATMGMACLIVEGFSNNGERAKGPDDNKNFFYAREELGLMSSSAVLMQELVSTMSWAISNYDMIDALHIGATGFSYGGCAVQLLAGIDDRINCISFPATQIGSDCNVKLPVSDIWIESTYGNDFLWTPPVEMPIMPLNSFVANLFPQPILSTAGYQDWGANIADVGKVMDYASTLYAAGGYGDRVLLYSDNLDHGYQQDRRQNTYSWMAHWLQEAPLAYISEQEVPKFTYADLEPDLSGSWAYSDKLAKFVDQQNQNRFSDNIPTSAAVAGIPDGMERLFGNHVADHLSEQLVSQATWKDLSVKGYRVDGPYYSFPVYVFKNASAVANKDSTILYLPLTGSIKEQTEILGLLNSHGTVIAVDYFGIGELKSNRIILNTFIGCFMNNDPSVPKMIINILRDYFGSIYTGGPMRVIANGWSASLFGACLQYYLPSLIASVQTSGVPDNELDFFKSGHDIPQYLLWNSLFLNVTVAELLAYNTQKKK